MDKEEKKANRWSWLPAQMPGVHRLVREKRREVGDAHVDLCWQRGVLELQPGWFFAREGAIAVGAPFDDDETKVMRQAQAQHGGALLMIRSAGVQHGA